MGGCECVVAHMKRMCCWNRYGCTCLTAEQDKMGGMNVLRNRIWVVVDVLQNRMLVCVCGVYGGGVYGGLIEQDVGGHDCPIQQDMSVCKCDIKQDMVWLECSIAQDTDRNRYPIEQDMDMHECAIDYDISMHDCFINRMGVDGC